MRKLKAAGLYGGIGSMLIAARQEGFQITENIEPRKKYFPPQTFEVNFGLPLRREFTKDEFKGADLLLMHPSCGKFSSLSYAHPNKVQEDNFPTLLPWLKTLSHIPVMIIDNLPGAMIHWDDLVRSLPKHDVFPEMIEAQYYGLPQRRRRLIFVCVHKSLEQVPQPNEKDFGKLTVPLFIKDIRRRAPNHHKHSLSANCRQPHPLLDETSGKWVKCDTYGDLARLLVKRDRPGNVDYKRPDGTIHHRPGIRLLRNMVTITGSTYQGHPVTGLPLSIRERARIQGFPDDFIFYPERLEPDGSWVFSRNMTLIKQTGKAVPPPLVRAFVSQAKAWLLGKKARVTGQRFTKSEPVVDAAKMKHCKTRGYSNQRAACEACAIHETCEVRDAVLQRRSGNAQRSRT